MNPYNQGKSHFVTMLCLVAGVVGLFGCPASNASALPAYFILLGALSGAQTYRSVQEDKIAPTIPASKSDVVP